MTTRKPPRKTAKPKARSKPAPTVRMKSANGINTEEITEPKLTVKQEKFAQAYIETGGNASEAYRRVYNCAHWKAKSVWERASVLLSNSKVTSRVAQLKARLQKRHEITVDDLVAELEEARAVALKNDTAASMVAASMGKAKLLGLVVDKNELTGKDGSKLMGDPPPVRDIARTVLAILQEAEIVPPDDDDCCSPKKRGGIVTQKPQV